MVIIAGVFLFTISILLIYIGRTLYQIKSILRSGKRQLEEYLRVICESAYDEGEDLGNYQVTSEEKQMLWSREEKEQLFNEVLQEIFQ